MGFYKNTNTGKANRRAVAESVFKFLKETNCKNFGLTSLNGFNGSLARPVGTDFSKGRTLDTYINDPDIYLDEQYTDNMWFKVDDDLKITFKSAVIIHRLSAKDIPFYLSEQNSVCISHVDDDVFDWLPESLNCIWINNAIRSNGSISFKNLKRVDWVSVVGCTKLKSLKGLEDLTAKSNVYIRYNKNLTTTEFAPRIDSSVKLAITLTGAGYDTLSGTYSFTNNPELEEININPKSTTCRIFIDDTCKKINKVTSLPSSTSMFFCKTLTAADLIPLRDAGTEIGYVELADFKGKGDAMKSLISSASEDSVKDQLKKIVDDIKAKHWRIFDDLYAILSFYNLERYAGFTEKSRYVEDGMIHSYDPVGERYRINYYASGVHRNNIKNGVCRYLNQLGVKYTIVNTGTKAKKETEFIKIQA